MSKVLKAFAVGIFATSLWPGTEVFDKAEGGELVREGVFKVGEDEYETDADGKIVDTGSAKATASSNNDEAESDFVNPFTPGVSYAEFLATVPDGVSVADHCKEHLTDEQIQWLVNDLKHYKK